MTLLQIDWYKVFYWVTVADGVKGFFDTISTVFLVFSVLSFVWYWVVFFTYRSDTTGGEPEDPKERKEYRFWVTTVRRTFIWCFSLMIVTWTLYVLLPSRKDALIIIAGGSVGNFITSDSNSRQIPAEITTLLREKIKSEIQEIKTGTVDTLASKTKEELLEIIKNKK